MIAHKNSLRRFLRPGLPLVVLALAFGPRASAQISPAWTGGCAGVSTNTTGSVTWTPAACQEFNGATVGPPDSNLWSVWSFDTGNSGFGNNELETYCGPPGYPANPAGCPTTFDASTANSYIDGKGHLVIQIMDNNGTWTSARMKTQGTQAFQYGRIEASAELPDLSSPGLWPAFWWLGTNIDSVSWPACGESDIMEAWADATTCGPPAGNTVNHSTIHYGLSSNPSANGHGFTFPNGEQMNTAYHAYGVIWSANMLQYYVNPPTTTGISTLQPFFIVTASDIQSGTTWPYNATSATTGPAFLLLNVAVGGSCGGTTPAAPGPYQMMVDYVRQYAPSAIPPPVLGNPPSVTVKAGATTGNTSTFTPTLAPGTGYVYFSCDTTAPQTTCSVQTNDPLNSHVVNSDANPPESVTVTISTTGNAVVPPAQTPPAFPRPLALILIAAIAALAVGYAWKREMERHWRDAVLLARPGAIVLLSALMVSCGGGSSSTSTAPPPAPSASISALPAAIIQGATVVLTVSTTHATSCTASASPVDSAWTGSVACNGTMTITPAATGTVTYSIAATGAGGSADASTMVTVKPATPAGNYSVNVYAFTEANMSDGSNSNADAKAAIPLTVN